MTHPAEEPLDPRREPAARPAGRRQRKPDEACVVPTGLALAASGRRVDVVAARDLPIVSALCGEDLCWQFARSWWQASRPPLWRLRERRSWRGEGVVLEEKRRRLVEMTEEVLGPAPPRGPRRARRPKDAD